MEKYFKMSDVFLGAKPEDFHINPVCIRENFDDGVTPHNHAIHAINSHDGLVAMNKELLAALELMVNISSLDVVNSDESNIALSAASNAIAKAKGTA